MRNTTLISLALFAAACLGKAGPVTPPTAKPVADRTIAEGTYPVADLPGDQQCWKGTMTTELSSGVVVAATTLVRRGWDASTSMVAEEGASWSGNAAPQRSRSDYKVDGGSAKFVTRYVSGTTKGSMNGTIVFTGEPGKWTAWSSEIDASGTIIKTSSTIEADKAQKIVGNLFNKGAQFAQVTGALAALDAAACKAEFSKIPPM